MRLRLLAVAVLLIIVVAGQAGAASAGQQQYIVKTKHLVTPPHTKAATSVQDFVRAGGGHVDYEWRDRLVVTLPDAAVQALMQHPAVEFVQKVTSGVAEGGTAAAESTDPVVTSSTFRAAPKSLPPWTSGTYSYDGEGNITAIGSNAYSYDAFSRLTSSTTNGIPETYTYDRYGNLTQKVTGTGSTAITVQGGVDDGNHLTGHCYDTAGNLTDDTDSVRCPTATETHSFDALNMMTMKWNRSAGTKEYYIYNANDERIAVIPCSGTVCTEQITFSFRDESGKVLRQFEVPYQQFDSPWTWVEDYVYRDGVLFAAERVPAQGGRRHFHVDHLGTPRLITDSSAHRISEHDYFPFGVEATPLRQDTVSPNNFNREEPMKFTGHERDFTVGTSAENSNYIDYMHARSTVPQWGRFLSVDPTLNLERALRQPQNWNRYSYVMNNPLRYTDPDGRDHYQEPGFTKPLSEAGGWADQPSVSWAFYAQGALLSMAADEFLIGPAVGRAFGAVGRVFGAIKEEIGLSRNILTALKSADAATQLEGEAAAALGKTVTGFQKVVSQGGKVVGEIDVETSKAIVEVTSGQASGKVAQITKLIGNKALNPSGKPVVVYGPNLGAQSAQALQKAGATVVRTLQELKAVAK